jgi:hypothetical protein
MHGIFWRNETIAPVRGFNGIDIILSRDMNYLRSSVLLFLIFSAFVSLTGCSKNSTSPPSTTDTTKKTDTTTSPIPTIGSSFITVDLDNGLDTTFDTVVATSVVDTTHHGSIVREIVEASTLTLQTFESFLTNGDLALRGVAWGNTNVFEVLPFASHTTIIDTFLISNGIGGFDRDSVAAVYNSGSQPFVLKNKSYATDSVTVFYKDLTIGAGYLEHYTFIPSLGLIAYDNTDGNSFEMLVSDSLK